MSAPLDVHFDGARFYVADGGYHRVMVWNGFPAAKGQPPDFVLGQSSFAGNSINAGGSVGPAGLSSPAGVVVAHGSLFIADPGNRRVVVHTPVPGTSGASAVAVLGQADLMSNVDPAAASQDA